jgi:hypothetical protein
MLRPSLPQPQPSSCIVYCSVAYQMARLKAPGCNWRIEHERNTRGNKYLSDLWAYLDSYTG